MKKKSKPQRFDEGFLKDVDAIINARVKKGLAKPRKEEISYREMTRLMRTTQSWDGLLWEMKTKPKRKRT